MWALRPALWRWGVLSHAIASLVTLSYKCKHPHKCSYTCTHIHTQETTDSHSASNTWQTSCPLLRHPQMCTHRHFLMDKGRQGCLHSNIFEKYTYLFLSCYEGAQKQPQPQPMASPTLCTPAFQAFTRIALRQEFRGKSFSLNLNLLQEEHNCNVKAGEACALFTHVCTHICMHLQTFKRSHSLAPSNNLFCT